MKIIHCVLILLLLSGCAVQCQFVSDEAAAQVFLTDKQIFETKAYKIYANRFQDDQAKIEYLINLVRYSNQVFCRNGKCYNGGQGGQLLDYKLNKFNNEVNTAEDFIDKIASHSRTSGKEYFLILKNRKMCPLKKVLYNELDRLYQFDQHLLKIKEKQAEKEINIQMDLAVSQKNGEAKTVNKETILIQ